MNGENAPGRFGSRPRMESVVDAAPQFQMQEPDEGWTEEPLFQSDEVNEDLPVYEGGPLRSVVESWKAQFGDPHTGAPQVFLTDLNGALFIWRPLNRYEYKLIMAAPATDAMQREEMMVETCVLWPQGLNYAELAKGKAGTPAALTELIMEASNFTRTAVTRQL